MSETIGAAVDPVDHRPQHRVAGEHEERQGRRLGRKAAAGERADGGRAPQRRRRVEPTDVGPVLQDHAGAEKADAGDDVGDDARRAVGAEQAKTEVRERGRSERDEHVGPQARRPLPPLALEPDERAEHEREAERAGRADEGTFETESDEGA